METTINIEDVLDEEEIKRIYQKATYDCCYNYVKRYIDDTKTSREIFLYKTCYSILEERCKDLWNEDLTETLKQRIRDVVNEINKYDIFYEGGEYPFRPDDSLAMAILKDEIEKARPVFHEHINSILDEYDWESIDEDLICDEMYHAICDRLFP